MSRSSLLIGGALLMPLLNVGNKLGRVEEMAKISGNSSVFPPSPSPYAALPEPVRAYGEALSDATE